MLVGLSVDGVGAHPGAWRLEEAGAADALGPGSPARAATVAADRAGLDFVLLADGLALQAGGEGAFRGGLDAVTVAASLAPLTRSIGLVPSVATTHTEPFHVATVLASLDHLSHGRAGWEVTVSVDEEAAALIGRRPALPHRAQLDETAEVAHVVTLLWDSWEDDAEIRDAATGRFIDRARVHHIDHEGRALQVKGPAITPRPPQGRPPLLVSIDDLASVALAGDHADVVLLDAAHLDEASAIRHRIDDATLLAGRRPEDVRALVQIEVVLGATERAARERLAVLDAVGGHVDRAGALRHVGTAAQLAEVMAAWTGQAGIDGFLLRPAVLATDGAAVAGELAPLLQAQGPRAVAPAGATLHDRLGLGRPTSRFASRPMAAR